MKMILKVQSLMLILVLTGCASNSGAINTEEITTSASGEVITNLVATATGRVSPFDGEVDSIKDLEDLVQSALGDASLDLHRGHDEIKNVLEPFLGISHEQMHDFMEDENLNLAGICERFGFDPENLLETLKASYAPWIDQATESGLISLSDADNWSEKIADALRLRVYWQG